MQVVDETTILDDTLESGEPKLSAEERNARDGNFLEEVVIDQCDQIAAKVRVGVGIYYIRDVDPFSCLLFPRSACFYHGQDFLAPYFPHSLLSAFFRVPSTRIYPSLTASVYFFCFRTLHPLLSSSSP